jgi:hypothetical protein
VCDDERTEETVEGEFGVPVPLALPVREAETDDEIEDVAAVASSKAAADEVDDTEAAQRARLYVLLRRTGSATAGASVTAALAAAAASAEWSAA